MRSAVQSYSEGMRSRYEENEGSSSLDKPLPTSTGSQQNRMLGLLALIHPAGQDDAEQLPRLQDKAHAPIPGVELREETRQHLLDYPTCQLANSPPLVRP